MKRISIEYLKNEDYVDYFDGDLFLIDDIENLSNIRLGAVEMEAIIVIICLSGVGQITMNGSNFQLKRNQLLLGMPHSIYSNIMRLTDNFKVKIIGISTRVLNSSVFMTKNIWKKLYYLQNNPVLDISENDVKLFSHYYDLTDLKINGEHTPFYQAIMMSLVNCVIFELLAVTNQSDTVDFDKDQVTQGDELYRNFLQLLAENEGRVRYVQDYADKLYVTPKYLSAVVKQMCGRTALTLIHETTIHAIVRMLKYTDKPIKEISDEMGFPSLSFFGKFVKKQLGVSPKKFRMGK
ncbi:MAG: helix-turn-helix transcriptional regulator [Bacteroidaceae bacterium]|nr:helix-turn-helix transcriptional regulator [Bacteroidaceae bacterium]